MLAFWLHAHEIDIVHWGQANAKTVDDLWQELMLGECRLQECPIMRLVDVTNVLVQQNGLLLREVGQELRNGRVRHRDSLPAEKMLPGEDALTTARRCLSEELNLNDSAFCSDFALVMTQSKRKDSPSYPGLPSRFTIYTVKVQVQGLPVEEFSTFNAAYEKGDPVRVHHWRWQESHAQHERP